MKLYFVSGEHHLPRAVYKLSIAALSGVLKPVAPPLLVAELHSFIQSIVCPLCRIHFFGGVERFNENSWGDYA
jgi:hypothetical protein